MGYQNNIKEYERILKLYSNDIYRMALLKLKNVCEAEDVFQDVFVKLYTANGSFHGSGTSTPLNSSTYKEFDINSMYVWDTVAALPQKYKDVIYLFYHEQYSTNEIADILDISTDNVKTRLKRAREILRKEVKDYEF